MSGLVRASEVPRGHEPCQAVYTDTGVCRGWGWASWATSHITLTLERLETESVSPATHCVSVWLSEVMQTTPDVRVSAYSVIDQRLGRSDPLGALMPPTHTLRGEWIWLPSGGAWRASDLTVWLWLSSLAFLSLGFLIPEMGTIAPISQGRGCKHGKLPVIHYGRAGRHCFPRFCR